MSHIVPLLVNAVVAYLETNLQTNVAASDPIRAKLVKPWRLQASPLPTPVYAIVTGGNPLDPKQKDVRIGAEDAEDLKYSVPIGEVGGGHYWWRRGAVNVGVFFLRNRYAEERAADLAYTFFGRVAHHLERVPVSGIVDEFGEYAYQIAVFGNTFIEGGGPEDQYLWRGEIWWQVLTRRPL